MTFHVCQRLDGIGETDGEFIEETSETTPIFPERPISSKKE